MPIQVPHLEQYSGPFAMEETAFNAAIDHVNRLDLAAHLSAMAVKAANGDGLDVMPDMTMVDGIAVIDCVGTMTKYGSSLSSGPSTVALRQCIRQAAADPKVTGILMNFDSPGGSAAGTEELASDLAAAAQKKPVWAYVDGMAASAAYWACSQCSQIVAAPAAVVGSIGTYGVMYDRSAQFAQNGVKAVVIKDGDFKAVGAPGTEITPDQISDQQRVVKEINALFIQGVANGRKMSIEDTRKIADGRVHVGQNAKAKGLVDQIGTFDQALAGVKAAADKLAAKTGQKQPAPARMAGAQPKEIAMSDETAPGAGQPQPATLKDLKQKFPKSTADWREKCQEDGLTMAQAQDRWTEHLAQENARLADELAQAKAATKQIGTTPLKQQDPEAGKESKVDTSNPKQALTDIAEKHMKGGMNRAAAFAKACKENPELHQAWIQSHTAEHGEAVRRGFKAAS